MYGVDVYVISDESSLQLDGRMKLGIAGYGYVGKAYHSLLNDLNPSICDPELKTPEMIERL